MPEPARLIRDQTPDAAPPVSLADQVACARRELGMRQRVYPRHVEKGRMTAAKAEREIAAMSAIVETLERLVQKERLL